MMLACLESIACVIFLDAGFFGALPGTGFGVNMAGTDGPGLRSTQPHTVKAKYASAASSGDMFVVVTASGNQMWSAAWIAIVRHSWRRRKWSSGEGHATQPNTAKARYARATARVSLTTRSSPRSVNGAQRS